jgi:glycosyltransferase involved in cell wall biosynthesis
MKIFEDSPVQKEKFRIAANKLLNHCFILKKKEDTRKEYVFIVQNKESFRDYFDLLGYELDINEAQGVVSLTSPYGTGRLRLRKLESILLLILRLLYVEKKKELSLSDDILVTTDDVNEKYNMLKIQSKPTLDKTALRDSMRVFKRYNIISLIDRDVAMSDARMIIYPSVLFALPNDSLNDAYSHANQMLDQYISGGEAGDDENIDQDTTD